MSKESKCQGITREYSTMTAWIPSPVLYWLMCWMVLRSGVEAAYCPTSTMIVDRTEFRDIPVYRGNKASTYAPAPLYVTQTIIKTQSVPYFVTQTQHVPQYQTRIATLPQYITQTVFTTHVKQITKTERTYYTITARRTIINYKTVCPYH